MSLKVIQTDTCRSDTYDFLLTFLNNHWPILHRLQDRRRFQVKIANFPTHVYFRPPHNWVSARGIKKLE